jgi:GTP cyclohydrolase II
MSTLSERLAGAAAFSRRNARPWVTLSFAQSLDGSLTAVRGQSTALSGSESRQLTHQIRAAHQAILVGVGTMIADDPLLNARYAEGPDPQAVILDSHLGTPIQARLLRGKEHLPWILCAEDADAGRRASLEAAGARLLPIARGPDGRLDLRSVLFRLYELNISTLMVEGGAQVITSFLAAGLVELLVITFSPCWTGGLPALEGQRLPLLELQNVKWEQLGSDGILWAEVKNNQSQTLPPAC